MRCDAGMDCTRPEQPVNENTAHTFSGWGFHVKFHPACCPGHEDGMDCTRSHPAGWRPSVD